ncbi:MAG: sigma-70 family RNA polymerase sigma factor [Planctomycetota bacterium]|nr:sigma-70 family RNA polymerase sigma factor [Planctomycetota bacterium]
MAKPTRSKSGSKDESPLLPRIAAGEDGAVEAFMDRYGGLVWSLARRMSPSRADAEDAVQEIFLDLWKSAERFDASISSEPTFVGMVARRRLIDGLNKRRRRIRPTGDAALEGAAAAPANDPRFEDCEEAKWAAQAFGELGEEQQRVLRLAINYGQTHAQIAEVTGLPLGTVKTLIRRGLIKVRKALDESTSSSLGEVSS